MRSVEQKGTAIETFTELDHSYAETVAGLSYPNKRMPNTRRKQYKKVASYAQSSNCPFSHVSLGAFYEHMRLLLLHGSRSAVWKAMVKLGAKEELLERIVDMRTPWQPSAHCSSRSSCFFGWIW